MSTDIEKLALDVKADFQKSHDAVKEIAEKALAESGKGVALAEEFKAKADEALLKMNGFNEKLADLEQEVARSGKGSDGEKTKSLGEQFTEAENVKAWLAKGEKTRVSMSIKATLTSLVTDTAGAVGDAIQVTRLAGILPMPQRQLTIRDLIAPGRMDGNAIEYVKETGFTNGAGMVAEGASKPSSDIKFDLVPASAKVIAHWMKASRQVLSDISQLRSVVDQRLIYGLKVKEEQQLLNGDNTGQNLHGIIPQATAFVAPITVAGATSIDNMRLAMLQAALAEYPATASVMNPSDWAWVELLKDTTGRYIIGNPQGTLSPTLWGLPVVATQAIAIDKFLTGSFRQAAQVFDRWDARVEVGYENDDFTKNLVTILAEERLALAVYRPEAFIYGDFGRVA